MEENVLKGNWNIMKGKAKEMWGALSDDELDRIDGRADQLIGAVQKKYGRTRAEAAEEVREWRRDLSC